MGDQARTGRPLFFYQGNGWPVPDEAPMPSGTHVHVRELHVSGRGRDRVTRVRVERMAGGAWTWAWLDAADLEPMNLQGELLASSSGRA